MATLREIVYNVKNLITKGRQSDDFPFSDRQVAFQVNYYRAAMLKKEAEKNALKSSSYVQNLGKVEVQLADAHECCDIDVCVLRTVEQLPSFLDGNTGELATYVGTLDYSHPFQKTTPQKLIWEKHSLYTSKMPKWYILNNYLYVVNPTTPNMEYINIQGIFMDPLQATKFRTCDCKGNDVPCVDGFDEPYPLDEDKIELLVKMLLQTEFSVYLNSTEDSQNETRPAPSQTTYVRPLQANRRV